MFLALSASFASLAGNENQAGTITIKPAPAFTDKQLKALPRDGWLTNGGNVYNQRYSPLKQINRKNIADLKAVWLTKLGGSGVGPPYSGEAQPIVYDGIIYIITGADDVFAISVETGEILWKYQAGLNPDEFASVVCCGWTSRGVGLGDGKVYAGQLDGKLLALDQQTGEVIWSVQAERPEDGYSITSAPLYYDGLLITGFAGAELAIRGKVKAYSAEDGSPVWTFHTVPGPGEFGHDTWSQENEVWKYGGASVWQTPAVDPDLGLIYFATGNPAPDFDGSVRPGDNLFSISVVALDVKTGKYRWHYQQIHHDLWDYDAATPVVLFDVDLNGRHRKAIVSTNKAGWAYILDRESGEPLLGIEEKPVPQEPRQATSPTQPIPAGDAIAPQEIDIAPQGYKLINKGRVFTPFWTEEAVLVTPSYHGATNWPASSYDPRTNILYVCGKDAIGRYQVEDLDAVEPDAGDSYLGGSFSGPPIPATGIFAALDMKTNKLVWRQQWNDICYSGSLATAGDLVFTGRNDGRLMALDSSDGMPLWEFQTGAGMNSSVSSFEYNGEQYIVAYAGGNLFANSQRGDNVWLFSLTGAIEEGAPPGAEPAQGQAPVHGEVSAVLESGQDIFNSACQFCHGLSGDGGRQGVPLDAAIEKGAEYIGDIVSAGSNEMPSFASLLSAEQIQAVSEYVLSFRK